MMLYLIDEKLELLLVILIIGAIILVVLNIFNVRDRKYEVGVLTAMGMKKWKVAVQFMCEILVVTMIAIVIGAGVGAVSSVPVTNALLENQVSSQQSESNRIENNFGRGGIPSDISGDWQSGIGIKENTKFGNMVSGAANYITEVNSAMNLTVVFQMIGIGLLLTLIASAASVLFIMRYIDCNSGRRHQNLQYGYFIQRQSKRNRNHFGWNDKYICCLRRY